MYQTPPVTIVRPQGLTMGVPVPPYSDTDVQSRDTATATDRHQRKQSHVHRGWGPCSRSRAPYLAAREGVITLVRDQSLDGSEAAQRPGFDSHAFRSLEGR